MAPPKSQTIEKSSPTIEKRSLIVDNPSNEIKIGYSKFLFSSVDLVTDIRIDGVKKVFHLLAGKQSYITYEKLKRFFRRRLEEISENEFNDLWKGAKTSMETAKFINKPIMTFEIFQDIILHQNSLKQRHSAVAYKSSAPLKLGIEKIQKRPFELYYQRTDSDSSDY